MHLERIDPTRRRRRIVLMVNGAFLTTVGATQVTLELLAHFAGIGPLRGGFHHSPYSIGWVENHGLAFLVGLLLLGLARDGRRGWHVFALAVHVLLGGANVAFWSSFIAFDTEPVGVAATTVHAILIAAHAWCLAISGRPTLAAADQPEAAADLIRSGR